VQAQHQAQHQANQVVQDIRHLLTVLVYLTYVQGAVLTVTHGAGAIAVVQVLAK
jgi:hypothetical protein